MNRFRLPRYGLSSIIELHLKGGDELPVHESDVEAGAPQLGTGSEPRIRVCQSLRPGPQRIHARGRWIWCRISGLCALLYFKKKFGFLSKILPYTKDYSHKPKIISFFIDSGKAIISAGDRQIRLPPSVRVHGQELPVDAGRREAGLGEGSDTTIL